MSTSKTEEWDELLATGGAETFFRRYPDNNELAAKLKEVFEWPEPPTAARLARERERFSGRPVRGEPVEQLEASPTKNAILNKARQLVLREALAEIIDNILDNYLSNTPGALKVNIFAFPEVTAAGAELVITETSGGLRRSKVLPLIQLGLSERSAKGIGAWGEGFKMAAFALAEEIEVFSTFPHEDSICVHFPYGWLRPDHHLWSQWKVGTFRVSRNPPALGTTLIRLSHLRDGMLGELGLSEKAQKTPTEVCEQLAAYFGEVYAQRSYDLEQQGLGDIEISLTIGNVRRVVEFKERPERRLVENLAFLPWLKPIRWSITWRTEVEEPSEPNGKRDAVLSVEILAGLAATFDYSSLYPQQTPGVEMWGNGRLFTLNGRIDDESVGWGYRFGGRGGTNPKATASSRRLMIVALFSAEDTRDVPWAAPVKTDYNRRSEFYAEIQLALAKVIRLFKDAVNMLEGRLMPYSCRWSTLTEEQKLSVLFGVSGAPAEFKTSFANSRFGMKVLTADPIVGFHELNGADAQVSLAAVNGVSSGAARDAVEAAAATKDSAPEVVEYLKAIFPRLAREAALEEELGLSLEEDLKT